MRLVLVILCVLNLLAIKVAGQVKFKNGFIVMDNSYDTVRGLISCKEYGGVPKNPTVIRFKLNEYSKGQIYKVSDVKYFKVGSEAYEKGDIYVIPYSSPEICGCGAVYEPSYIKTVWLKLVMTGDSLNLYIWDNKLYTARPFNDFFELGDYNNIRSLTQVRLLQLADEFGLREKLSNAIRHCYSFEDLKSIIAKINKGKVKTIALSPHAFKVSTFAGAGTGIGEMSVYRYSNWPDIPFIVKGMPYLTAGTDISATFTTLFIRLSLSYSAGSFKGLSEVQKGTLTADEYTFFQKNISPGIGLFNNFWDNGILSFYGGIVLNQNFSTYKKDFKNVRVNTSGYYFPIEMKQSWRSVGLSGGAMLNHKWDINIQLQQAGKFATSDADVFFTSRALFVSVRYHFLGKQYRPWRK